MGEINIATKVPSRFLHSRSCPAELGSERDSAMRSSADAAVADNVGAWVLHVAQDSGLPWAGNALGTDTHIPMSAGLGSANGSADARIASGSTAIAVIERTGCNNIHTTPLPKSILEMQVAINLSILVLAGSLGWSDSTLNHQCLEVNKHRWRRDRRCGQHKRMCVS